MSDDADAPAVSVRWYIAELIATITASAVLWGVALAPLLFGDPAWVSDTTQPDSQMRAIGRGITLPTIVGIAFVTVAAVAHGWLYVNYPRLLDR